MDDSSRVSVHVPAKINLFLAVRGLRDDGYHELTTVLQTVDLRDELELRLSGPPGRGHHPASRGRMRLQLEAGGAAVPTDGSNLAVRAAHRLGHATNVINEAASTENGDAAVPVTHLRLRKTIPVAGGMAGGSADAAAALVGLNVLWDCNLSREALRDLAADLGSDVPFCVVGGTALATGRGTGFAQVLCRGAFHWVVGIADTELSTRDVYAAWDERCAPSEVEPDAVLAALRTEDPEALGAALHNDLETAAFALRPELAQRKRALLRAGALGAVLSGSGPTLLGLCEDAVHAARVAARVRHHFARVEVVRSPAGGPTVE